MAPPCSSPRTVRPAAARRSSARDGRRAVRWVICALLFFAATINYIDRQVIGILKPTLQQEFGWSEIDYADIVFAFQLAYAIGLLLAGPVDRSDRRAARLHRRDRRVEPGGDGARRGDRLRPAGRRRSLGVSG